MFTGDDVQEATIEFATDLIEKLHETGENPIGWWVEEEEIDLDSVIAALKEAVFSALDDVDDYSIKQAKDILSTCVLCFQIGWVGAKRRYS